MASKQFACIIVNFILLTFVSYKLCTAVKLKLTNLECEALNHDLITFRQCRLRVISRGLPALNIHLEFFRPVSAIEGNLAIYKKANGYKPFLYNISFDYCKFMETSRVNIIAKIVFNFIAEYSNLNHSCPYSGVIIVQNLVLTEDKFRLMPLPSGEYMVKIICSAEGQRYAVMKIYFSRIE